MSKDIFHFKQFSVCQKRSAMKVGTDGVLLGAWASGGATILDIGTGTGLIAMMMAQRFSDATVTAIEIDDEATQEAKENVEASPFSSRISVSHTALQDFQPSQRFDAIVCNPPFFTEDLHSPDKRRATARHCDTLSYAELAENVARLMTPEGKFSVIIPTDHSRAFITAARASNLFTTKELQIVTSQKHRSKRTLIEFSLTPAEKPEADVLLMHNADGSLTIQYTALTKDIYL